MHHSPSFTGEIQYLSPWPSWSRSLKEPCWCDSGRTLPGVCIGHVTFHEGCDWFFWLRDNMRYHDDTDVSDRTEDVPSTSSYTWTFGDSSWRGVTFPHMAQPLLSFSFVLFSSVVPGCVTRDHLLLWVWLEVQLLQSRVPVSCSMRWAHTDISPLYPGTGAALWYAVPFSEAAVLCSHNTHS